MTLALLTQLSIHSRKRPDAVAIREVNGTNQASREVTFHQLSCMVAAMARTLEQAVSPGDVVVICQANRIECTVAFLGTLQARAVGFLVNPSASDHELRNAAKVAGATAMIAPPEKHAHVSGLGLTQFAPPELASAHESIDPVRLTSPDDYRGSGLMLLSSGTTGDPKIAMRSGPSLDAVARNVSEATGLQANDRVLGMIPLCHSYGVEHGILAPTYAGCAVHLCRGFDTRVVIEQLTSGAVTVLPGVPSIFELLARWGDGTTAFPQLRCAYSAGSQLPMTIFDACQRQLQLRVGQLYGSSEVGSVTFNSPHAPGHDPMSSGLPMTGVITAIVDPQSQSLDHPLPPGVEGELAIHAPSMLDGYVGQNEPSIHNGYFLTGDLARVNTAGQLTITGRIKLLIDVGALKVNPLEVESVLAQHDEVQDCVVVGTPVTDTISRVRAVVVPRDIDNPPSSESLRHFARARLSAHKVPRVIDITESLPKSPTGKILRRQIAS